MLLPREVIFSPKSIDFLKSVLLTINGFSFANWSMCCGMLSMGIIKSEIINIILLKETAPKVAVSRDLKRYPINIPIITNIVDISKDKRIIVKKFVENIVIGILKTSKLIMKSIDD